MMDPTLTRVISRQHLDDLHRAADAHRMAAASARADGWLRRLVGGRPAAPAPIAPHRAARRSPLAADALVSRRG